MHELHTLINFIKAHEQALSLLFTTGGLTISISLQTLLHKIESKSPVVAWILSHLETAAATAVTYKASGNDISVLPTYATLWIGSQFWHQLAVNPIYNNRVLPFLEKLNQLNTLEKSAQPTAAPEGQSFS